MTSRRKVLTCRARLRMNMSDRYPKIGSESMIGCHSRIEIDQTVLVLHIKELVQLVLVLILKIKPEIIAENLL